MDASFKLTRQEIGAAYDAGRDAVVALIEALTERYEQRITALEQELQELKKDSQAIPPAGSPSRDSFERKQHSRTASRRQRTGKRPGGQPNHPGAPLAHRLRRPVAPRGSPTEPPCDHDHQPPSPRLPIRPLELPPSLNSANSRPAPRIFRAQCGSERQPWRKLIGLPASVPSPIISEGGGCTR